MTEQGPPMRRPIPAALVVARRAMVVAAAAMVIAALAVVVALLGEPGTDPAETAAVEQARDDASSAQEEADAATAMADAAIVIAEEAAAVAAAAQAALADAMAAAGETVDPATIARLEAQLEEARNLAATALVAADAAGGATGADDEAPEDGTEAGQVSEPEEPAAATDEDAAEPDEPTDTDESAADEEAPAIGEDAAEPDDTGAAADLPGEPLELGPAEGAGLAVVGIRYDSALNMRAVPNGEIIARLDNVMDGVRDPAIYVRRPDSDDIITTVVWKRGVVATGNTRALTTSTWHEFLAGDLTGWSSAAFLAQLGATEDATSEVVDALGELPVADTMVELGLEVAQTMASQEPQSSVVVSGAPGLAGDLGQVTIDIVGIGDDSVRGFRLVVFAHPAEDWTPDDPGPFTLKSVERTVLCHSHRGVSADGVCN
ncbi:MAG: hypothetical protein OXG66_04685 [Acidimicrobiaceae bacterium]|nr:hypothetical protein [Acidimicrobiaceae bacterium]